MLHVYLKNWSALFVAKLCAIIVNWWNYFQTDVSDIKENGIDEKMEVDPPDNNVPSLKKVDSFRSTAEVIKQMATEVDHSGYTPLLLACRAYSTRVSCQ